MFHSDCNVSPVILGSNSKLEHATNGIFELFVVKYLIKLLPSFDDKCEISRTVHAPFGCVRFRHCAIDISPIKLSGRAHQKSRSIVCKKKRREKE